MAPQQIGRSEFNLECEAAMSTEINKSPKVVPLSGVILSEKEEMLLVRYFDDEHSFLDGFLAKRLIARSSAAREFMDTLNTIGAIARSERPGILSEDPNPVDLWDKISARIDEEERSALYLGTRSTRRQEEKVGSWSSLFSLDRFIWGLSGGAVAACMTYYVVIGGVVNGGVSDPATIGAMASNAQRKQVVASNVGLNTGRVVTRAAPRRNSSNQAPVVQVAAKGSEVKDSFTGEENTNVGGALESSSQFEPIQVRNRVPTALEVDWVRSDGRVRMVQDVADRSAIIWVKKRQPSPSFGATGVGAINGAREPLIVYRDRLPQTIPVVNGSK